MSFDKIQDFVFKWEGGFCDDKNDPGGATNYGICVRFLKGQSLEDGDMDGDGDIDVDDIKKMTKSQARYIMKKNFWDKDIAILDYEHPRMAMVTYDTAVNMGLHYAKKLLQEAIGGLTVDGIWGPKTWAAIKKFNDLYGAVFMIELRRGRYAYLVGKNKKLECFYRGWINRCNDLEREIRKYGK